jgi:ribosome-binding factor A
VASIRHDRVQEHIKEIASTIILFELKDPRLGFVTITKVDLSSDMRSAKIYYSVLGSDVDTRLTAHAMRHSRGHVQREIAKRLRRLRYTPIISFEYDDSPKTGIELSGIIERAIAEDEQRKKQHENKMETALPDADIQIDDAGDDNV